MAAGYVHELTQRGWNVSVMYGSPDGPAWEDVGPIKLEGESFSRICVPTTRVLGALWSVTAASTVRSGGAPQSVAFERVLAAVRPDVMHVIDNVNLPIDWPERAAARGIPVVRTVSCAEDLCGLIAPVSPLSDDVGYCLPPLTTPRCAACVATVEDFHDVRSYIPARWSEQSEGDDGTLTNDNVRVREELIDLLRTKRARSVSQFNEIFTRVVFSSNGFRSYFERTLPLNPAKVRVIPLGIDPPANGGPVDRVPAPEGIVRFVFAGTLAATKGLGALSEAFLDPMLLNRSDYRLEIHAGGDERLIQKLLSQNPNVIWRGAYIAADLPALLADADVGLSPSQFETFHRVTREYQFAGLPVIGSTAFGIPEAVRHGVNGLLFDHADRGSLRGSVVAVLDDPALLTELTAGAGRTNIWSVAQEADELIELYRECV